MRSRSLLMREMARTKRRSVAMSWCSARSWTTRSSISICNSLMASSSSRTRLASCSSESSTAWTAWCTERSAKLPIQSRRSFNSFRSFSKCRSMKPFFLQSLYCKKTKRDFYPRNPGTNTKSSEASGDVSLRARIARRGEELRRRVEFDELADEQERREVAHARGLLHVVGNGDNGAKIFQLHEQLLDFCGADGIERGARLV